MKKIHVSGRCNGCGLCIVNSAYLQEDADGNAVAVPGKYIAEQDMPAIDKLLRDCPEHALSLTDVEGTQQSGKSGARELLQKLKHYREQFKIKEITWNDVKLDCKKYDIPVPYSDLEYQRDYSSESSARSAAKDEFKRLCYSEAAYTPMIKKIFVEYKVNILKPYYTCEDVPGSAYFKYNQEIRTLLSDLYAGLQEACGHAFMLPETWKEFSVYLSPKDGSVEALRDFDDNSTCSGIMTDFRDRGKYTELSYYIDMMGFDYDEIYEGSGFFGDKYKKMWYFEDFNKEVEEFVDDIKSSINYMSSDIAERAAYNVNVLFSVFEHKVKDELGRKITELEKYIQ